MQKRLLIVLGLVVAYRFLSHIPVPIAEPTQLKEVIDNVVSSSDFGGFLNLLSGGALASFSIVLVGLGPYITASIVMQLLTKVVPRFEELHKDGESGRRKINQWTRLLSLPLAIVQSIAFIFILRQTVLAGNVAVLGETSPIEWVVAVTAMTAGAMLLMWLGELMTEQGVGNGISLLIFAGIISQLPQMLATIWTSLFSADGDRLQIFNWFTVPVNATAFFVALSVIVTSLIVLYLLVKINEAQRVIDINYAKRVQGNSAYGGVKSLLPIKLITAGVVPVIFAVAFLALPAFIGQLLVATGDPGYKEIGNNLVLWFQAPQPGTFAGFDAADFIYPVSYFALVVLFTYFYTGIVFNTAEIAENLQKQGGFIENIRPGVTTEKHLRTIVNRLTLFGSLALGLIAILPFVAEYIFAQLGISAANLAIGGTGLLIVVTVAIEALRQINSRALMVTYDEYK
ncbi:MAG TPA: preprotein translocase subunit SecY [Candidatus Saccharimonadales bacterium]